MAPQTKSYLTFLPMFSYRFVDNPYLLGTTWSYFADKLLVAREAFLS